jgi:enterochelin esterase-like enzyme
MNYPFYLILLLTCATSFARNSAFTTDTVRMNSAVLNENRVAVIYKPLKFCGTGPVRFLYLLDGERAGYRYQGLLNRFADTLSDVIAVGILNTDRKRDMLYVYGADKFLEFITQELIPRVEKDYQTRSRLLYGHSFAGSFTLFALLNRPGYFDACIASSLVPVMKLADKSSFCKTDSVCEKPVILSISCGSKDLRQVRKGTLILKNNLTELEFKKIKWSFTLLEGKNHGNSDVDALILGYHNTVKACP